MKPKDQTRAETPPPSGSDLLLLPDGRLLVHNLTPAMAELLRQLDPEDQTLRQRAEAAARRPADTLCSHELPN